MHVGIEAGFDTGVVEGNIIGGPNSGGNFTHYITASGMNMQFKNNKFYGQPMWGDPMSQWSGDVPGGHGTFQDIGNSWDTNFSHMPTPPTSAPNPSPTPAPAPDPAPAPAPAPDPDPTPDPVTGLNAPTNVSGRCFRPRRFSSRGTTRATTRPDSASTQDDARWRRLAEHRNASGRLQVLQGHRADCKLGVRLPRGRIQRQRRLAEHDAHRAGDERHGRAGAAPTPNPTPEPAPVPVETPIQVVKPTLVGQALSTSTIQLKWNDTYKDEMRVRAGAQEHAR